MCLRFPIPALLASAISASACCMVPAGYNGTIGQSAQEAILFHDGEREDLVLKIDYEIKGRFMPPQFAWVITVPEEPDHYAVTDRNLFQKVFDWANPKVTPVTKSRGQFSGRSRPKARVDGLEFGKLARVGPYEIQPVRARGRNALDGLNRWLLENLFPVEDPKHMRYFIDKGFTFLCIKISSPKGDRGVDRSGSLPPLHLSFKSETPYYPLRFSSRQGAFNVNLYLFTQQKLDYLKSSRSLSKINWVSKQLKPNVEVETFNFPHELAQVYRKSAFKDGDKKTWLLNVIRTEDTNKRNGIKLWKEDLFFYTVKK